jgi:hypothetical protein
LSTKRKVDGGLLLSKDKEAKLRRAQIKRNQVAIHLLDSWLDDDSDEQRQSWESIKKSLDEDRFVEE